MSSLKLQHEILIPSCIVFKPIIICRTFLIITSTILLKIIFFFKPALYFKHVSTQTKRTPYLFWKLLPTGYRSSLVQTEHTDDNILVSHLTHLFALLQLKISRNRNYLLIISNCAPIRCFYNIRTNLKCIANHRKSRYIIIDIQ